MTSQPRQLGDASQHEYRILRDADLREYLAQLPEIAARLGGSPTDWSISEVGDGNLNLVFIVKGSNGGIAVKQALPYVRLVGESWPLPLSRSLPLSAMGRRAAQALGVAAILGVLALTVPA